mmetsp:Transcript_5531/g.10582  ORF Transcript_5531/g.10582 Transcript_5531/m.10582 type:complete len:259 (-) Transcript_5531:1080-1856(-)
MVELLLELLVEASTLESPDRIACLHLIFEARSVVPHLLRDGCNHVTRRWVPLHICQHEVLILVQNLKLVVRTKAAEQKITTIAGDCGNNKVLTIWSPNHMGEAVGRQIKGDDVLALGVAQRVKEHLRFVASVVGCKHSEAVTARLPEEALHCVLNLNALDRDVLLSDAEDLELTGTLLLGLRHLRHQEAKVVTLRLPMHGSLDLCACTGCELTTRWYFYQCQPCWIVVLFQRPNRHDVVFRRPLEGTQTIILKIPLPA